MWNHYVSNIPHFKIISLGLARIVQEKIYCSCVGAIITRSKTALSIIIISVFSAGQTVTIRPSGRQVKTIDSGMIYTCVIEDITEEISPPPDIRWRGPTGEMITATVGRYSFFQRFKNAKKLIHYPSYCILKETALKWYLLIFQLQVR